MVVVPFTEGSTPEDEVATGEREYELELDPTSSVDEDDPTAVVDEPGNSVREAEEEAEVLSLPGGRITLVRLPMIPPSLEVVVA